MIHRRLTLLACSPLLLLALSGCAGRPARIEPQRSPAPAASGQPVEVFGYGTLADDRAETKKIDPSKVRGRLSPEIIQKVVRADFDAMTACYEAGLARDASLAGKITTKLVIARDGTVSSAADIHDAPATSSTMAPEFMKEMEAPLVQDPRFPDPKVIACVVARFKALKFPPPQGGTVTVVYPIVFNR